MEPVPVDQFAVPGFVKDIHDQGHAFGCSEQRPGRLAVVANGFHRMAWREVQRDFADPQGNIGSGLNSSPSFLSEAECG
jgi:hypothetical protein